MTLHPSTRTSVATLLGANLGAATGGLLGRVQEFAVAPTVDATHVTGLLVRASNAGRSAPLAFVAIGELRLGAAGQLQVRHGGALQDHTDDDAYLWLERDLLDQQIIDVHGHKVVRVNDVDLAWEPPAEVDGEISLRIVEVEVGMRGAIRRLLKGAPRSAVDALAHRFRPRVIPWEFVDLIDRDPARRVRLKIEQERLSKMHPSDLADILEDLAPAEREALFTSLDEEVAAEALEEVEPKTQKALIEALDSGRVAGIVEEMDPGAAADLLAELPEERSEAILGEMNPEERLEVQELLEFAGDSAAGRMTTEYVALPQGAAVKDAVEALRNFKGDAEVVTDVYLIDSQERLCGVISVVHLLFATADRPLADLPQGHVVSCELDTSGRKVAELFDKYNLRSLPVVDRSRKVAGVIHGEQVIALLRESH